MASLPEKMVELLSSSQFEDTIDALKKENAAYKKEKKPLFDTDLFKIKIKNTVASHSSFAKLTPLDKRKYKAFTEIYYEPFLNSLKKIVIAKAGKKMMKTFSSITEKIKAPFKAKNGLLTKLLLVAGILFLILDKETISNAIEKLKEKYKEGSTFLFETFKNKFNEKYGNQEQNVESFIKITNEDINYLFDYYFSTKPETYIKKESIVKILNEHFISSNIPNIIGSIRGKESNLKIVRELYNNFYRDENADSFIFKFHDKKDKDLYVLEKDLDTETRKLNEYALSYAKNTLTTGEELTNRNIRNIIISEKDRKELSKIYKTVDGGYYKLDTSGIFHEFKTDTVENVSDLWTDSNKFLDVQKKVDGIVAHLEGLQHDENAKRLLGDIKQILPSPIEGTTVETQVKYHAVLEKLLTGFDVKSFETDISEQDYTSKNEINKRSEFFKEFLHQNRNWFSEIKNLFVYEKLKNFFDNIESYVYETFYKKFERTMNFFVDVITSKFYNSSYAKFELSKASTKINLAERNLSSDSTISKEGLEKYENTDVKSIKDKQRNYHKVKKIIDNVKKINDEKNKKILETDEKINDTIKEITLLNFCNLSSKNDKSSKNSNSQPSEKEKEKTKEIITAIFSSSSNVSKVYNSFKDERISLYVDTTRTVST